MTEIQSPNRDDRIEIEDLYGASEDLVSQVRSLLEVDNYETLLNLTSFLHTADIADLIYRLEPEDREKYLTLTKDNLPADVLTSLDENVRDDVFLILGPQILAKLIVGLESDDAAYIIENLKYPLLSQVLRALSAKDRAFLKEIFAFPEDSAGRLMQREIVCVPPFWTAKDTLDFLRTSPAIPDLFYQIFVVDPRYHPLGVVALSKLMRADGDIEIESVLEKDLITIPSHMDQEDVANLFRHYALVSAPVVNNDGRIIGVITADDVVEVIEEEAEEDIMHLAGISESDFNAPTTKTSLSRLRWLVISLINTLVAASVINQFEATLSSNVHLAVVMGIVAAMGGNAGMQVVTVIVRAISTRELRKQYILKALRKELLVAFIIGLTFAFILGAIIAFWLPDPRIGMVLGGALFINMLWAGLAGTILPIFIQRLGMDPAISSGPMLTTTTDVLGYAIFLGLATLFLG